MSDAAPATNGDDSDYEQFEREGLFDDERKKFLPLLPKKVGLVTAAGSDAEQDFIETVHNRYPDVNIAVESSKVQGDSAPETIAKAVRALDESNVD